MDTVKIMIVDDEKLVINDLMGMVDWQALGFEIVAIAHNGKQALAKFDELNPDVVITDIKMPFMDGISLIKNIRSRNANTIILILSAYGDFEYAKQAINYDITDYLLKEEINQDVIASKLKKVKKIIADSKQKTLLFWQSVLVDYFNDNGAFDEIKFEPNVRELFFKKPYYYLIIEEDIPLNISVTRSNMTGELYVSKIIECCNTLKQNKPNIFLAGRIRANQVMLLVKPVPGHSGYAAEAYVKELAATLKNLLEKTVNISFSFFYISDAINLAEMKKIYKSRTDRFLAKYLFGTGKIYNFRDHSLDLREGEIALNLNAVDDAIEKMDVPLLTQAIESLFAQVLPPKNDYKNLIRLARSLYTLLNKHLEKHPDFADKYDLRDDSAKSEWTSGEKIKTWMIENFTLIIQGKQQNMKYSKVIIKSIDYIQNHFQDHELSISKIANFIGMSETRLSVLFKKETGDTINNTIKKVRIEKAKEYLLAGEMKIYEISDLIGYGSSQYFSQIFYNETGMTPNDYRRGIPKYENQNENKK